MSDREHDKQEDPVKRREIFAKYHRTTDDPHSFLFDVDPAWAQEYIDLSQKLSHLPFMNDILNVSPRVVRIALLRPHSLIRLLDAKWKAEDTVEGDAGSPVSWAVYRENAVKAWLGPMERSWLVAELADASECFKEGMSPLEAMVEIHADCEDGEENERPTLKPPGFPSPLFSVVLLAFLVAIALKYYMYMAATHAAQLITP